MAKNRYLLIAMIGLVVITAAVTFAGTYAFMNFERTYLKPEIELGEGVSASKIVKFNEARKLLKNNFFRDVDDNTLIEGAIDGMARSLEDPYTVYFSEQQMKDFLEKSRGTYSGIGIYISVDPKDMLITVIAPIEGTPAERAGLLPGDKVVKVDDKDVTGERDEDKVINMIKGIEGTRVKITVYRPSTNKFLDYDMARAKIDIKNIRSEIIDGNIGYIKLVFFDENTATEFATELAKLVKDGIKGLIIDLRDNPGGIYGEVVRICDRILPEGVIVYTEDRSGKREYEYSDKAALDLPIAVIVNEYSASASEILAGALKDHKKAAVIGKKTFGKGLVQDIFPMQDGAGLKVTVSEYFTPSGTSIQGVGVQPDIEVALPEQEENKSVSQITRENDTQLTKAVEILKTGISGR